MIERLGAASDARLHRRSLVNPGSKEKSFCKRSNSNVEVLLAAEYLEIKKISSREITGFTFGSMSSRENGKYGATQLIIASRPSNDGLPVPIEAGIF
jgi:hypothetical protein